MSKEAKKYSMLPIVIVISITLVLIASVGAWLYVQNRTLNQEKQINEYNQQQINNRKSGGCPDSVKKYTSTGC